MKHVMGKPDFCLCESKGADQLCSYSRADQHLCFRYMDNTIPLLIKTEASSHRLWRHRPVCVRPGWKHEDQFSCVMAQMKSCISTLNFCKNALVFIFGF